jgi:serine/threonine-protein kinase RsbW
VAFTKATHRGLGCLNALFDALIVHAGKAGDHGLLVTGVTTHPFSQKTALKYGLKECALMLSKTPSISFQNIDDRQVQRENLMLFFRFMEARGRVEVFVPPHHRTMIGRLYQELGEELRCMELPEPILADEPSQLDVTTNPGSLYAEIKVKQAGRRVVDEVHLALRQLCINRFETIFLKLDLASPSTALLCAAYEKLGFFFAGILPQRDGHDLLVLQYLNNQRPDYEAISVASDLGRDLLAYVRSQDASQAVR